MPSSKIIVVRTGDPVAAVLEKRGHFSDLIREAIGGEWAGELEELDARRVHADAFPDPGAAAAFVITGSAANIPNREPWMLAMEAWLVRVHQAGTPIMGLCFGHQILAQALGGEVQKNRRGREIGTVRVERLADDPIFDGLPATFEANATHIDTVVTLPPGAVALARSSLEDHHVIRFSETVYGVQFHPEIDGEVMRLYLEARREACTAEGLMVDAIVAQVSDAVFGRKTLQNFIRHVVPLARV